MAKRKLFFISLIACFIFFTLSPVVSAETNYKGKVVKMAGLSTLYYVADDGKRYVFPTAKIYNSWFSDFSDVVTLSQDELQTMSLGGNVRYRPGVLLVKITTDPKVYAVTNNGRLRWVMTEALARALYGENWNILIDDVPDSFFTDYEIDDPIDEESDYDADTEANENQTIDGNRGMGKMLGHAKRATTRKCRAIPAVPNGPGQSATPAVPARECILSQQDSNTDNTSDDTSGDDSDDSSNDDIVAPNITITDVTLSSSSASIAWTTDKEATSLFRYTAESLATADSADITEADATALGTEHNVVISGLTASTTYYYDITATGEVQNASTTEELNFTTLEE